MNSFVKLSCSLQVQPTSKEQVSAYWLQCTLEHAPLRRYIPFPHWWQTRCPLACSVAKGIYLSFLYQKQKQPKTPKL